MIADFLTRLIERTHGAAHVAQPIIQPMFAVIPNASRDFQSNSSQNDELLNTPNNVMVHSTKTRTEFRENFVPASNIPQETLSSTMPRQLFHKIPATGFAPPGNIKSDHLEHVERVSQRVIRRQIEPETSTNTAISEPEQNTIQQPEHFLDEKQNEPGKPIDSQHEHLLYDEGDVSGRLIGSEQESPLRGITKAKRDQDINQQSELSFYKKQNASGRLINSKQESAMSGMTEFVKAYQSEISDPKPHSLSKIRFQKEVEQESPAVESTIKVTIGRVEVRAIMPPVSAAPAPRARSQIPILSLNDYLKQRNEGQR